MSAPPCIVRIAEKKSDYIHDSIMLSLVSLTKPGKNLHDFHILSYYHFHRQPAKSIPKDLQSFLVLGKM